MKKKFITIGITGGVGAGKSAVLKYIEKSYNCKLFVTDLIAYEIMRNNEKCFNKVLNLFAGYDILNRMGTLDSKKIGKIIFKDENMRNQLNSIVHPKVIEFVKNGFIDAKTEGYDFAVVESALLIESGLYKECLDVWYVYASEESRIERLKSRNYTKRKSKEIISGQLSEKDFKSYSDIIIDNSGKFQNTCNAIDFVLSGYQLKKKNVNCENEYLDKIAEGLDNVK